MSQLDRSPAAPAPSVPPANPYAETAPPANPYAQPVAPTNPYAPPQAQVGLVGQVPGNAEAVRREHLNHEASIRSIGSLYLLGGILYAVIGAGMIVAGLSVGVGQTGSSDALIFLGTSLFVGLIAALFIWIGRGLRNLEDKAKLPTTVLAAIGLLGIPLGTLINGYILYLIHSAKGKRIFSDEYRAIRAETPHIRYKTPLWMWIVLGVIVAALIAFVVAAFMS